MAKKKKKKMKFGWLITLFIAVVSWIGGTYWTEWDMTQVVLKELNKQEEVHKQAKPEKQAKATKQAAKQQMEIPIMTSKKQGQIIHRTGYTLSYDSKTKTPQWVAWELTQEETKGKEKRTNDFKPDPDVIGSKVVTTDYSNSGYDRGHMAPAADMKWSKKAMKESFYMSNICPQNHHLNTEDWGDLEEKCRQWARKYGKVYIACGPIYNGKRNEYIGERRVKVPDAFFKVVLINEKEMQCALGFLFDNEYGKRPLKKYQVPVDKVEQLTGMDFFSALPDDLENWLESEVSNTLL